MANTNITVEIGAKTVVTPVLVTGGVNVDVTPVGTVDVGVTVGSAGPASGINQLTSDVLAGPGNGSQVATIANDAVTTVKILDAAVTNAKLEDMAQSTMKGRASGSGTGVPIDLTPAQSTANLNEMVGDTGAGVTKGLVPAAVTGGASTNFLRKDGTWAIPPGTAVGDMTKAVYDPQNAGYISGANGTGTGGTLKMYGGSAGVTNGGHVYTYGGGTGGSHGGSINAYGDASSGGSIITFGGSNSSASGGSIITNGGSAANALGGTIRTDGGSSASANGGAIATYGGTLPGGSINTADGGGNISTVGVGSIQMGVAATRTTLVGSASSARTITLPDATGTVALTSDIIASPVKAWVNFDGGTAADVTTATYSRTLTTVTVSLTAHGYLVGSVIYADFTSGGALDGVYTVTGVAADTFTLTTVASGTIAAGSTMNILRRAITASSNIHSVTYQNTTGRFYVNFAVALSDANYVATGACAAAGGVLTYTTPGYSAAPTAQACEIATANTGALANFTRTCMTFIR